MANIMQQVKLKNHTSRDAFDLSHRNAFTAKVGELLPVSCIEMIPGDSFNIETQHFTRTMPVNTAAYTRMREYYDWFFVPTELLWNKFNSFVTQMVDNNQHATGINSRQVLTDTHPYFTTNQVHTILRTMADSNYQNMFGFSSASLSRKLLEYLDYGKFGGSIVPNGSSFNLLYNENVNLNPFPLLAYQKIYQDYFRNSQWENAYAPAFNLDYISGATGTLNIPVGDISLTNGTEHMFTLRYANWHKDLFTGVLPNSQYGSAATIILPTSNEAFEVPLATSTPNPSNGSFAIVNPYNTSNQSLVTTQDGRYVRAQITSGVLDSLRARLGTDNFSILALRQAEALQKWKEVTQSQQQDYKSQIEAHFGVSPDNGYSDRCSWIDGSVSNLDISEVTNQNITGDNAADIAGKGVGVGQGKTRFKTSVHGYLMCIYHCVPLLDFDNSGVTRQNLKTKVTDYAIPEFDRTGMVSVPLVELSNTAGINVFDSNLIGYAPRYYDYKQKIDKVHGGFTGNLSQWVAPINDTYLKNYLVGRRATISYTFFKVNPKTLNPIFASAAGDDWGTDQLLVNAAFDIKAVRNLDRNGLPY